jgi:hypothetical protein
MFIVAERRVSSESPALSGRFDDPLARKRWTSFVRADGFLGGNNLEDAPAQLEAPA